MQIEIFEGLLCYYVQLFKNRIYLNATSKILKKQVLMEKCNFVKTRILLSIFFHLVRIFWPIPVVANERERERENLFDLLCAPTQ